MPCPRSASLLVSICLLTLIGCAGEEPLAYCSEDLPCPAGLLCDIATNTCSAVDASAADASAADAGIADGLAPDLNLGNGSKCGVGGECKSGFCADNLCCATQCAGVCRSCALVGNEGACTLSAKGKDPGKDCAGKHSKCGGTCDGKGACSFAPVTTQCKATTCKAGKLSSHNCDGKGDCASSTTDCGGYACAATGDACRTTCAGAADCGFGFQCLGNACVSDQANGKACGTNNKACASGNCVDGVCCSSSSCTICNKCNISGKEGSCAPKAELTQCGAAKCVTGIKTEQGCKAGKCAPLTSSCGDFACNVTADDCLKACKASTDCAPSAYCAGALCVAKAANGATCTGGGMCLTGSCVDGVCCGSSSCGTCNRCNISGKEGSCAPAVDLTQCGATTCLAGSKTTLGCKAGKCAALISSCGNFACNLTANDCLKTCKSSTDCAPLAYCSGTVCTAKAVKGTKCTSGGICISGNCVDGVCCGSSACGKCNKCNISGKAGTCSAVPNKTSCGSPFCSTSSFNQDVATVMTCQSGKCTPNSKSCGHYLCDATKTACSLTCKTSKDCYNSAYCGNGLCLEKKPNGSKCTGGDQCKNYLCTDGYCCDKYCEYDCASCNLTGKEGKCTALPKGTTCGKSKCNQYPYSASTFIYTCKGVIGNCNWSSQVSCTPYGKCNSAQDGCAKSCAKHDQCTTGYCDTSDFFGTKNRCAAKNSDVCYVHTKSCGDGTKAKPYCSIQKCLDRKSRYVLVSDGKYSENLVVKADVAILSSGTNGTLVVKGLPQQNVARVFLTPQAASQPGISVSGKFKVWLYGLDVSHTSSKASGDLVTITAALKARIETCAIHDGNGSYNSGILANSVGQLSLDDVALYKFEGHGLFAYNTKTELNSVGVAFAAGDNLRVYLGSLRLRDVLVATGGTAGVSANTVILDVDRVRTQFNSGYGFFASSCTGHVSNLLSANNRGHGVYLDSNKCPALTNLTVADNAPTNWAIYDIFCHKNCGAKIDNSIIWSATASGVKYGQYCQFSHSDVRKPGSAPLAGTQNINSTPLFTNVGDHPYSLAGSSPCVDAGDDSVLSSFAKRDKDLRGLPRLVDRAPGGTKLDMGAFEVQ